MAASLEIQKRDLSLLSSLFESRVMTSEHIAALYFEGSGEAAKKRLQKIKAAGLISERGRRVNEPATLTLSRKGFTLLQEQGQLSEYPPLSLSAFESRSKVSEITVRHELEIMDVKAAFHTAIRDSHRFAIEQFSTWPRMYEFKAGRPGHGGRETLVRPDGFIRINVGVEFEDTFFLEVDRSTEQQDRLAAQAVCYRDYFVKGGFAVRNGATRDKFKDFPFRVLMVFKSADRRNNTAERLLQVNPPILTQVCLSTMAGATTDPLGPVWIQPRDYREAVAATRFEVGPNGRAIVFHPQPERNALVEARIPKFRLLSEP